MAVAVLTPNPSNSVFMSPNAPVRIELAWVTASDGTFSLSTPMVAGAIVRVQFVPDQAAQPNAGYSVVLTDTGGTDVLYGLGGGLSNVNASDGVPTVGSTGIPPTVSERLTLGITGAGNAKRGTVVLYVRP